MSNLIHKNEKGMVLPLGLMFLAIISILGTTAVIVSTTDLKIGSNYRASEQAFCAAEAGIEEARARLRGSSTAANYAGDPSPYDEWWSAYILTSGSWQTSDDPDYDGNYNNYIPTSGSHTNTAITANSLQTNISYFVKIRHKREHDAEQAGHTTSLPHYYDGDGNLGTNPASAPGNIIYYDPSITPNKQFTTSVATKYKPVEIITAYGQSSNSLKIIEVEMTRVPPTTVPAALYVEASTKIQGSSTNIIGTDSCGTDHKPGIATTKPDTEPITTAGNPTITGVVGADPDVSYNTTNMDIQSVLDSFKGDADFAYTVSSATHTGTDTPGPGDVWGTPTPGATLQDPSSCSDTNIVYYNTQGTDIKLSGGVTGCGILLVDGDLDMHGGFSWHGMVIVTGSVIFLGGGDKNITGALIAGGSLDADIIGGNSNIVYCSSAIDDQTKNRPLRILSWQEKM